MPEKNPAYDRFAAEVQARFETLHPVITQIKTLKTPDTQKAKTSYADYDWYATWDQAFTAPYLAIYHQLQSLLNPEMLRHLVAQYQALQPRNCQNFSDKIAVTHEFFDVFREMQGLPASQIQTLLHLKRLLSIKHELDFTDKYGQNFSNKTALKIRSLFTIAQADYLPEVAHQYQLHHGVRLVTHDPNTLRPYECAPQGFFPLSLPETQSPAAVALYRIALAEMNSEYITAPLLYVHMPLIQTYSTQAYTAKIKAILVGKSQPEQMALLSATDIFFHQTALSAAVGMDNTHAALAFIQEIHNSNTLSAEQKQTLLNHRSSNANARWSQSVYSATPLLLAIQRGNKPVIKALLNIPYVDVNQPDLKGLTPLDWAFIMADAECCQALLKKGADPTNAYYHQHPWIEDIWTPSPDMLDRGDYRYTEHGSAHPELRQLQAHFWDSPHKLYQMRHYNPQADICAALLQGQAPAITATTDLSPTPTVRTPVHTTSAHPRAVSLSPVHTVTVDIALPNLFIPDFQQHSEALIRRQQTLATSNIQADQDLSLALKQFNQDFNKRAATLNAIILDATETPANKKAALQTFKQDLSTEVLKLQVKIQTSYPKHRQSMCDHVIMLLNRIFDALKQFIQRLSNLLRAKATPIVNTPYKFFEEKISTERLLGEFGSAKSQTINRQCGQ